MFKWFYGKSSSLKGYYIKEILKLIKKMLENKKESKNKIVQLLLLVLPKKTWFYYYVLGLRKTKNTFKAYIKLK